VWEAIEAVFERHAGVHLRLVGTGDNAKLLPAFTRGRVSSLRTYDEATMIDEIFRMDIGVYPLQDVERSRMRGVLKATNYMCGEATVVASPVGQSAQLIRHGMNGLLARTTEEWITCLMSLIEDMTLRRRLAANALRTVRLNFTRDQSFALLSDALGITTAVTPASKAPQQSRT
jgi:hypothetical protein